jgi:hypothetical protein
LNQSREGLFPFILKIKGKSKSVGAKGKTLFFTLEIHSCGIVGYEFNS